MGPTNDSYSRPSDEGRLPYLAQGVERGYEGVDDVGNELRPEPLRSSATADWLSCAGRYARFVVIAR